MSKICDANSLSLASFGTSSIIYIRSKRDNKAGDKLIFSTTDFFLSYLELTGFAAAKIEVLEFNWQTIPALAIEIVCCYIASNRIVLLF